MSTDAVLAGGRPTRRRVLTIAAAAAGCTVLPRASGAGQGSVVAWRGVALGAVASLQIHHTDKGAAERLIRLSLAEIQRLERVLSLYRQDSALAALNRDGLLLAPPRDLVAVLTESRRLWELSGGAFDPSVQPLWNLYQAHFSRPGADPAGPPAEDLRAALRTVGFGDVVFDRDRVVLPRRGMALTLNGIAQGYATDRIVDLLRSEGIAHSLVDMGESRAIGDRPDYTAWQVGIADPAAPGRVREVLEVADGAVATSGAYGFLFDPAGRFSHLLDPRTGLSPRLHASVTVAAPTAATADGLSTAFSLLPPSGIEQVLAQVADTRALVFGAAGERSVFGPSPG